MCEEKPIILAQDRIPVLWQAFVTIMLFQYD
jgi:hypothetical protein